MCSTKATEYRAKPKPDEIAGILEYAKKHALTPHTMIAVRDPDRQEVHLLAQGAGDRDQEAQRHGLELRRNREVLR